MQAFPSITVTEAKEIYCILSAELPLKAKTIIENPERPGSFKLLPRFDSQLSAYRKIRDALKDIGEDIPKANDFRVENMARLVEQSRNLVTSAEKRRFLNNGQNNKGI